MWEGYTADHYVLLCTFLSVISTLALWLPSTMATNDHTAMILFVAYVILYSVTARAYVSLFPTVLVDLFGFQHFASGFGLLYMLRGLGTLIGTPSAGALILNSSKVATQSKIAFRSPSLLIACILSGAALGALWVRIEAMQQPGNRRIK